MLYFKCLPVSVMWLFFLLCVSLQCVIVVFPYHTQLFFICTLPYIAGCHRQHQNVATTSIHKYCLLIKQNVRVFSIT